jgi:hypothetical protein
MIYYVPNDGFQPIIWDVEL